ncbi:MAG: hypothetical protein EB102_00175 [Gammaproteobacteria bacterium]|nr:hypothetical protein [Gammaproteobacteria bacterium]
MLYAALIWAGLAVLSPPSAAIDRIVVNVERVESEAGVLGDTTLDIRIDSRTAMPRGTLRMGSTPIGPLAMSLALQEEGARGLRLKGEHLRLAGGTFTLSATLGGRHWAFGLDAADVAGDALLRLGRDWVNVPKDFSVQGSLDASLQLAGRTDARLPTVATLGFRAKNLAFSNAEGSIAAENVDLDSEFELQATAGGGFGFTGRLASTRGEALFDNFYLKLASYPTRIDFAGFVEGKRLEISSLDLQQQGLLQASARAQVSQPKNFLDAPVDLDGLKIDSAKLVLQELRFPAFYTSYLQTALAGGALDSLESSGSIAGTLEIRDNRPISGNLQLDDLYLRDTKGLFFIEDLRGRVSWVPDDEEPLEPSVISWDSAGTYDVRGASSSMRLVLRGRSGSLLEPVRLPVFDGAINVQELRIRDAGLPSMQVQFTGEIEPISLAEISKAFGWPALGGFVTGRIPAVEYKDDTLRFGGDLEAEIFDGIVRGSNIKLSDPLGRWPRLTADLALENLDLETITSTLEFGAITGRIEGRLDRLELFAWAPVAFDAWLRTPATDRSRKLISVDAINNIANVGGTAGTGVAAAMQGGLLRFFSRYRYKQLAIRCVLEDDVCQLSGSPIAGNRYYLLEGAGLPRVDIIGNSGRIQWSELVDQIAWQIQTGGTFTVD